MVLDRIFKLYDCGVGFWYTGHVKNRSSDDVFTGESYDQLTTSMTQRYFNSVKNKTHFLGIAYIDRAMEEEEYGEQNPITKKRKTRNKITAEARKVKFRDDSYTADSKCRFASIIDEVSLDADELIEAMKNAINEEENVEVETAVRKSGTLYFRANSIKASGTFKLRQTTTADGLCAKSSSILSFAFFDVKFAKKLSSALPII
jgi:hypothetical protein